MIRTRKIKVWLLLATCFLTLASSSLAVAQRPEQTPPAAPSIPPSPSEVVWVNTASGFYHKPNSRHYGKTKRGKYMTEPDAIRAGYRPARN
jgi:hypothetical protein